MTSRSIWIKLRTEVAISDDQKQGQQVDKKQEQDRHRQEIRTALEKLRAAIRAAVLPREQSKFIAIVDQIQEQVMSGGVDVESIQANIQRSRGTTRRQLRQKPVDMCKILNAIDGLEEGVIEFFNHLFRGKSGGN